MADLEATTPYPSAPGSMAGPPFPDGEGLAAPEINPLGAPAPASGWVARATRDRIDDARTKALLRHVEPLCLALAVSLAAKGARSVQRRKAELEARGALDPEAKLFLRMAWWERRIEGAYNVSAEVETCGELVKVLRCHDCGHAWSMPEVCDHPLLCGFCQRAEIKRRRPQLLEQIERVEKSDHRGRRFLTLSVPHRGTTGDRVRWASRARARFFRQLGRVVDRWAWWASLEATEGDDGLGHLHWHAITVGPFIPEPLVSAEWGDALECEGCDVLRRPLVKAIERLKLIRCSLSAPTTRRLLELARVKWGGHGAPRREPGEAMADYVIRRGRWGAHNGGRERTVNQIAASYRDGEAWKASLQERRVLERFAEVAALPHAIADIRISRAKSDVSELCKYAIKVWETPPELHARIWYELKRHGWRVFQSSRGVGLEAVAKDPGCPKCGGTHVRPEAPVTKEEFNEKMARLSRFLAGKPPAWLAVAE